MPRAFGRKLWDIKLGRMRSFCHRDTVQTRFFVVYTHPCEGVDVSSHREKTSSSTHVREAS